MTILCLITIIAITHNIEVTAMRRWRAVRNERDTMNLTAVAALEAIVVTIGAASALVICAAVSGVF
jgi:hypothetical protein